MPRNYRSLTRKLGTHYTERTAEAPLGKGFKRLAVPVPPTVFQQLWDPQEGFVEGPDLTWDHLPDAPRSFKCLQLFDCFPRSCC